MFLASMKQPFSMQPSWRRNGGAGFIGLLDDTRRSLVLYGAFAALRNVPQHAAWIHQVRKPQPPWLHRRCFRRAHAECARQIQGIDMLPPSVRIVDHQLHHEILGPVFLIVPLQDEAAAACFKDGDVAVKDLVETKGFVEALGQVEILAGRKGRISSVPVGTALISVSPSHDKLVTESIGYLHQRRAKRCAIEASCSRRLLLSELP